MCELVAFTFLFLFSFFYRKQLQTFLVVSKGDIDIVVFLKLQELN